MMASELYDGGDTVSQDGNNGDAGGGRPSIFLRLPLQVLEFQTEDQG